MRTLSEATSSMTIFIFMRLFKKVLKLKNRQKQFISFIHSYSSTSIANNIEMNIANDVILSMLKPENEEFFIKNTFQETE